jgi:hypothetical protein
MISLEGGQTFVPFLWILVPVALLGFLMGFGGMWLYQGYKAEAGILAFVGAMSFVLSIPFNFAIYFYTLDLVYGIERMKSIPNEQKISSIGVLMLIVPTTLGFELARRLKRGK